jgi:hypothetical protein
MLTRIDAASAAATCVVRAAKFDSCSPLLGRLPDTRRVEPPWRGARGAWRQPTGSRPPILVSSDRQAQAGTFDQDRRVSGTSIPAHVRQPDVTNDQVWSNVDNVDYAVQPRRAIRGLETCGDETLICGSQSVAEWALKSVSYSSIAARYLHKRSLHRGVGYKFTRLCRGESCRKNDLPNPTRLLFRIR